MKVERIPQRKLDDLKASESALERIQAEVREYQWLKANQMRKGAFTRRQAE